MLPIQITLTGRFGDDPRTFRTRDGLDRDSQLGAAGVLTQDRRASLHARRLSTSRPAGSSGMSEEVTASYDTSHPDN